MLSYHVMALHYNITQTRAMVRPSKFRPPIQKYHHPTGPNCVATNHLKFLHMQNLTHHARCGHEFAGQFCPKINMPWHGCLLVGVARWEGRLRGHVAMLKATQTNEHNQCISIG